MEASVGKTSGQSQVQVLVSRTLLVGFITACLAALCSLLIPNQYQAQSALLVAPMTLKPARVDRAEEPPKTPALDINYLMPRPLSVPDYDLLLMNDEIADKLRGRMKEMLEAEGRKVPRLNLENVRKMMKARTRILAQTSYAVEYQPIIELAFTSESPKVAAALANEWARLSIELAEKLADKQKAGISEFLKTKLDETTKALEDIEAELEAVQSQWGTESRKKRLLELNSNLAAYEYAALQMDDEIADKRGQYAQLQKDIEGIPDRISLRKAPPDAAYWLMEPGKDGADADKVMVTEEVYPLFHTLRDLFVRLQSTLSGVEQKRDSARKQIELLRAEISGLEASLATNTRKEQMLMRKRDAYKTLYTQVLTNYEAARIAEADTAPDLKVAYQAVVPERKISPHRSVLVMVAGFLGLLIVPLHLLGVHALHLYSRFLGIGETSSGA